MELMKEVKAVMLLKDTRVLIAQRVSDQNSAGKWELQGERSKMKESIFPRWYRSFSATDGKLDRLFATVGTWLKAKRGERSSDGLGFCGTSSQEVFVWRPVQSVVVEDTENGWAWNQAWLCQCTERMLDPIRKASPGLYFREHPQCG